MADEVAAATGRSVEKILEDRDLRKRFAERDEFVGCSETQSDAAREALEVEDAAEFFADFAADDGLLDEMLDGVEASFDGVAIDERAKNPRAEEAGAHASDGG